MSILRCSLLEARNLGRALGVWPYVAVFTWPVLVKLQQPDFFFAEGVPFYWVSMESLMFLGFGLLPLCPRYCRGEDGSWSERLGNDPFAQVLIPWLSVLVLGLWIAAAALLSFYTVHRILGFEGGGWGPSLGLVASSYSFLMLTASLSPVVLRLRARTPALVFAWLGFLGLALAWFGPSLSAQTAAGDFSDSELNSQRIWGIVSTTCAAMGGLAFSLAHYQQRQRLICE